MASILQWRAKHLRESILQLMLDREVDNNTLKQAKAMQERIYQNPLIQSMNHASFSGLVSWNILRPLLTLNLLGLGKNLKTLFNFDQEKVKIYKELYATAYPSYLQPETFATVLIEELNKETKMPSEKIEELKAAIEQSETIPPSLQKTLISLADRAATKTKKEENEILVFQKEIENWFDRSMGRASGVYKRSSQLICFVLGLFIAVLFNLDSLHIYSKLLQDTNLRTALASSAETIVQDSKTDGKLNHQKLEENINEVVGNALPITLITQQAPNLVDCPPDKLNSCSITEGHIEPIKVLVAAIGWTITALAIYMGAPFWFELLGKLVNVRSTGSKPK
jgi:hypothetical protein